jgi:hypothetical protein
MNVRHFYEYYFSRNTPRCTVTILYALLTWTIYWALRYTGSYIYGAIASGIAW